MPPPGVPGPFSLEDADLLVEFLLAAGLAEVTIEELPVPYRAGSVDEWWQQTCALTGPLAQRLATLPDDAAQTLRRRVGEAAAAFATADGLELPGVALIASARRPAVHDQAS